MGTTNILDMNNRIDALEKSFHEFKIWATAEAKSVSGNPITLSDGSARNAEGLVVTFEPKQSGSGTPSPTNVRPITGLTECVVDVKDEDETTQHTATITFGQTVYGGSVDFKTGKVTVTHGIITYDGSSDENWLIAEDPNAYFFILKSDMTNRAYSGLLSNEFEPINTSSSRTRENTIWSIYKQIHIHPTATITPSGYTNDGIEELKTWLSTHNLQVAYELATPIELTLTPAELELLKGYNYISTNGTTIALDYLPDSLKADILLTVSQLYGPKISIFDEILAGGDTGQVLTKASDDNYDATWATLPTTRTTNKK